jgi:hypothetical protein
MKKLSVLALIMMLGFGQAHFAQAADGDQPKGSARTTKPLPEYYRLNAFPATQMNDLMVHLDEMVNALYDEGPQSWVNFRNKHFLQRTDEPVQNVLMFYKDSVETFREELAIVLDYIYLYNKINQNAELPNEVKNALKTVLLTKIDNKFLAIKHYVNDNISFRTYGVKPSIEVLNTFSRTLDESVTTFIPVFALRDITLRNSIVKNLKVVYKQLLDEEFLSNNYKDYKAQQQKEVDRNLKLIAKHFTPASLWERTKTAAKKVFTRNENLENFSNVKSVQILSCERLFTGSM